MNRVTSTTRDFAQQLIAYELSRLASPPADVPPAFLVCDRLRPHLATLMGNAGFRAMLARALSLAGTEVPWLRTVKVSAEGSLEVPAGLNKKPADDVVLLSQLLGLMGAFIGENLTRRLVLEVWPKLPCKDLDFGKGNKS